jgi:MATE family multidrug resistance protein
LVQYQIPVHVSLQHNGCESRLGTFEHYVHSRVHQQKSAGTTSAITSTVVSNQSMMSPQEPTNGEPRVQYQYQSSTSSSDYHHTATYKTTPQSLRIRLWREISEQWKTAFPAVAGMLLYKFPWLISLRFVGGIGATELAAAALASTLCNVTGLSLSVGLSSAMTTLAGQAVGDLHVRQEKMNIKVKFEDSGDNDSIPNGDEEQTGLLMSAMNVNENYQSTNQGEEKATAAAADSGTPLLPLVYLYLGIFIQVLFVLPIGLWWIHGTRPALIFLGQGEELATMTEAYLRILTPGLWSYSVNWTMTAWLQAVGMPDVPAFTAAFGLATHVPVNIFFIHTLKWGYLGAAAATVTFQIIQPFLMLTYLFLTQAGRARTLRCMAAGAIGRTSLSFWVEAKIAVSHARGIIQYLGLALPGIITISEWWASEIAIFLAGRLIPFPDLALGAMTLYQSINTFCFMFPQGLSVAGSTRVGNLLGAGRAAGAAWAAKVAVLLAGIASALVGCILFFTPHGYFPSLFAPDEPDLILQASRLIPLLSLYVLADGIQSALNGIIKGCGRQVVTMPIVVFAYWFVGIPLAYYLAFVRHDGVMLCEDSYFCGDVGLVTGMTVGTWVHMLLLGAVVVGTTNWEAEAKKANERVGVTHS